MFIMGTFSESLMEEYGAVVAEGAQRFSSMLGSTTPRGLVYL
jgi:hypothetical protein